MKAITCSQCGALIKRISLKDKFANCDYCGAKILIEENKERIIEIRDKVTPQPPKRTFPQLDKRERDRLFNTMVELNNDADSYDDTKKVLKIILAVFVISLFIFVPVILVAIFKAANTEKNKKKAEFVSVEKTPKPEIVYQTPAPLPDIKYRSYVQYNTNIDADLIEIPVIKLEQLPTTDLKELKKTVFANRKIRVRITINENGDVIEAKALNGHQVLQESSVEAAKKSLFSSRKRKTTTVLTYIYILE
jgi:DNA-directed RNA polymerase subunit RPC12/RpoP